MIKEIEIQEVFFQHETVGYPENGTRCGDSDVLFEQVGGKLEGGEGLRVNLFSTLCHKTG